MQDALEQFNSRPAAFLLFFGRTIVQTPSSVAAAPAQPKGVLKTRLPVPQSELRIPRYLPAFFRTIAVMNRSSSLRMSHMRTA